jgi:hypothetical protein
MAGVNLSEAQNPIPPPPILTHCIHVYSILIHIGKGGRVEPERRLEKQKFTKDKERNIRPYKSFEIEIIIICLS